MAVEVKDDHESSEDYVELEDSETVGNDGKDEHKIHISRVPTKFSEEVVKRILETKLGSTDCISEVTLIYPKADDPENENGNDEQEKRDGEEGDGDVEADAVHRGFGFVTFTTSDWLQKALDLQTIRGGRKPTSTKKHTMYLRPYHAPPEKGMEPLEVHNVCYLWSQNRCPYGTECKFSHTGPGGCRLTTTDSSTSKKKKQKCFAFKKGKCARGEDCPFSHDFVPTKKDPEAESKKEDQQPTATPTDKKKLNSEKDCINWKTKGKCRKGDKCPYRHDVSLQKIALEKINKKKRQRTNSDTNGNEDEPKSKRHKQPLSVRVFGLNYDTTEQDVRDFFQSCGPIVEISYPKYEDSGRSKGYCGVLFQSPKAVDKAIELDGQELLGRWLRIQAGKMYLKQWEENEKTARERGRYESESLHAGDE